MEGEITCEKACDLNSHDMVKRFHLSLQDTTISFIDFLKGRGYNLRGELNFEYPCIHTALHGFCISVCRVKLWNKLSEELQQCFSMTWFKKRYRNMQREEVGL